VIIELLSSSSEATVLVRIKHLVGSELFNRYKNASQVGEA
jgi:hypothetical protein